ncbi:peptidoglycan DD-metalloendopeptidase family protein [Agromyces sp. CFH 90414]|uniref:Peptidoglycan DD-metalloendopeptidase family protein n=1 Tax=Agromyces agglutinans TaxID=2662258 RepID=A0A6I2F617_9MICO|nr:M23 family metallopeptidase [Agromyces agglutinans]MRG60132.1 peptidoglycan DD-metalloendopeptidase family protein [Agromyces agglutinans]
MDRTTAHRPDTTRRRGQNARRTTLRRTLSGLTAIALAITLPLAPGAPASPASAATYPSWDELQAAKANTAAGAAAVQQIIGLIAELEANVEATRAEAERRMVAMLEAQDRYDDAVRRADEIQAQADASAAEADTAKRNAGQVAAQLFRTGSSDLGVNLMFDSGDAATTDALLAKLGSMDKMVERTSAVYERAQEQANTARSLGDQAKVAQGERERLRIAAEEALVAAQEAQAAAEAALAESQAKKLELEAQLAFLRDVEAKTTAAYEEGERIRKEEERKRREALEAALRAGAAGTVSSSGWARPASGGITSGYGPRSSLCGGGYCSGSFHYAYDLGTGCDAPIYAANAGVVTIAGWSGSYGNYVKINHGGDISTGYAHIRDGGTLVGGGQWVEAGQLIARSGTTGASTGCHLHFEVWHGGARINPGPFMADRGVGLG